MEQTPDGPLTVMKELKRLNCSELCQERDARGLHGQLSNLQSVGQRNSNSKIITESLVGPIHTTPL